MTFACAANCQPSYSAVLLRDAPNGACARSPKIRRLQEEEQSFEGVDEVRGSDDVTFAGLGGPLVGRMRNAALMMRLMLVSSA